MTFNIGATTVINSGCCLTNIANAGTAPTANHYVIRDANGIVCANNFIIPPQCTSVGGALAGGFLICKASGISWIVSPRCAEVSRCWYFRCDATERATAVSGNLSTLFWFVPTCSQLQNPGYVCRTNWDSFSVANHWSDDSSGTQTGSVVRFNDGGGTFSNKLTVNCVRAFRYITY